MFPYLSMHIIRRKTSRPATDPLKPGVHLHNFKNSVLTPKKKLLHYKDQLLNAVEGYNRYLF
jgi:hypothetical protein